MLCIVLKGKGFLILIIYFQVRREIFAERKKIVPYLALSTKNLNQKEKNDFKENLNTQISL